MAAYITSTACISPQNTANSMRFPDEIIQYSSNFLQCVEPNYKDHINPVQLRRMSKILKMGLGASAICLKKNKVVNPDAILVGTGLGCGEDLEKFLTSFLDNNEQVLSPTPFIQSTHNMVAAQIAVVLKNHSYNMTYCHRGFSFENALIDAIMLINEGQANNVLVGGIDEMTQNNYKFYDYLNYWKKEKIKNLQLLESDSLGSIAGEGACFFSVNAVGSEYEPQIKDVSIIYKPKDYLEIEKNIDLFLEKNNIEKDMLDLIILGLSGDNNSDKGYRHLMDKYFDTESVFTYYKHLCGEFMTSSSFALWLADNILRNQKVPDIIRINHNQLKSKAPKNILIYNHYRSIYHSLMLISGK